MPEEEKNDVRLLVMSYPKHYKLCFVCINAVIDIQNIH